MAMHSAAILAAENRALKAANKKQKRKQERRHTYIGQEDALTIEEGIDRVRRANEEESRVVEVTKERPQKRAARQCSICRTVRHTAHTCSQRTRNSS